MKSKLQPWKPLLMVFILLNSVILLSKNWLSIQGVDHDVALWGNIVLMAATSLSFGVFLRSLRSVNPQASVRAMYGSFMIKFFICAIAAFIYIMMAKKNVNKPALIICMGLYIVYTSLEISAVMKMLKKKKNA